jgi:hypothetical protein
MRQAIASSLDFRKEMRLLAQLDPGFCQVACVSKSKEGFFFFDSTGRTHFTSGVRPDRLPMLLHSLLHRIRSLGTNWGVSSIARHQHGCVAAVGNTTNVKGVDDDPAIAILKAYLRYLQEVSHD